MKIITWTLAISIGVFFNAGTQAQESATPKERPHTETKMTTETVRAEESVDWGHDKSEGRSRLGMSHTKLPGKTTVLKSTTEITQVFDVKQKNDELLCESDIDLEYYQKDTATEVRTLFSSSNCTEFDATYQLRIMYFDANGEIKRIVADEQWPAGRKDQYKTTYPMEANSDLRRVTSRILSCTCRQ